MSAKTSFGSVALALLVALVVGEGILVDLVATPGAHPGGDNAAYISLADALAEGEGYVERWEPGAPNHTKYPPVFSGLLALLLLFGAERWVTLKLVAAAAGVVTVVATWLWARRRLPEGLAAAAALATGLSYTLLYHTRYVLSDVPFLGFTMLALWLLQPIREDTCALEPSPSTEPKNLPLPLFTVATLFVGLAYFTRSAGLPLLLAFLAALAAAGAWRRLGASAVVLGALAAWWTLRPGSEQGEYGSEFFLIDPYDPAAGRIGLGDLVGRGVANAEAYLTAHLPTAIAGPGAPGWVAVLVLVLVVLALVGWGLAIRPVEGRRPAVAELFLPLYLGVVLVWPEIWSGDRFALPLVPILLVYALEALRWGARTWGGSSAAKWATLAPTFVLVAVLAAAAPSVRALAADGDTCAGIIQDRNAWTCAGAGTYELVQAARWSAANLPEGAAVLARKPRIFHLESGLVSRVFPFLSDPGALFGAAEEVGADYLLLDRVAPQALRFLGPTLLAQPDRFCSLRSFSVARGGSTELLGILPTGRPSGSTVSDGGLTLASCPPEFRRDPPGSEVIPGDRIPILID